MFETSKLYLTFIGGLEAETQAVSVTDKRYGQYEDNRVHFWSGTERGYISDVHVLSCKLYSITIIIHYENMTLKITLKSSTTLKLALKPRWNALQKITDIISIITLVFQCDIQGHYSRSDKRLWEPTYNAYCTILL